MTSERTPASCDSCGKEYLIPDPAKTYSCKACGGQISAIQVSSEELCPECNEAVPEDADFCTHCGCKFGAEPVPVEASPARVRHRARAKKSKPRSGKDRENRRSASHELSKAFKFLKILRTWFLLNVILHAVTTAFVTVTFGIDDVDLNSSLLMLVIQMGTTALMLVGYFQVFFRPFLWSVVLAGMVTLSRAITIVQSEYHMVVMVVSIAWALLFWLLVIPTSRVRKLIEANPDLYIVKRISGAGHQRRSTGSTSNDSQEAFRAAEKRAWRKALAGVAVILIASVASSFAFYQESRIPNFEDTWVEFQEDWHKGDAVAVSNWFGESSRSGEKAKLRTMVENRNWGKNWPSLEDTEKEFGMMDSNQNAPKSVVVEASYADGITKMRWSASDGNWRLTMLQFPDPDFTPSATAWTKAWNANDLETLGGFFINSSKMQRSLRSMADRRDWKVLPQVQRETQEDDRAGYRTVYLETEQGEVRVRWKLDNDQWIASSIKPPKK